MSLRNLFRTRSLFVSTNYRFGYNRAVARSVPQTASYATHTRPKPAPRFIRIPPLPVALISVGFICLGIGLYEHLTSDIQNFPQPIRQALRKALYYQQNKDMSLALKYFKEALSLALESSEIEKNGAPLTGIMIQLGALQEKLGRLPEARQTLIMALRHSLNLHDETDKDMMEKIAQGLDISSFSPMEQKKMIGIAQKLGDITALMKRDDEAEKWYVWSVEHLLKSSSKPVSAYGDTTEVVFDQEHMPDWLTKTDVGGALEALGGFYAAQNKPGLAIHLYLRALSLTGMESCQASVLMNNLAEAYSGLGQFEEAKTWGQKGLDLARNPNTPKINKDGQVCDETCGVLLFNMGMLFEVMEMHGN
ncbi:uncharacterized protein B0P05DRAFT_543864 [Gilbertella persicaria]|uniref:uncharacterized protein n=1 Tax=Gilbertella persicaria TaxID=101096 RepID=UPI00221F8A8F|nr:uncharacterized protein B0P05DRAFT_543864 [Gilbertella persicaria]KAI8078034.1 hypothetical protein B0P05DRAFT_543864 [Gilbertella persicaria]